MKKFVAIFFLIAIFLAATLFSIFYYWAKQPNLLSDQYYVLEDLEYPGKKGEDTIKVLTYNIGYLSGMTNNLPLKRDDRLFNGNLIRCIKMLEQINPDVVGFQEIDFGSDRSYGVDQLNRISQEMEYSMSYRSINWDIKYLPFPYWPPSAHFGRIVSGQAITSRFRMQDPETLTLDKPVDAPFYYNTFYIDRLVQMVDMIVGERVVKLFNVHLEAFDPETRVIQAQKIKQLFETYSSDYPVIMIGDFNSAPPYESVENEAMTEIMNAQNIASCINQKQYQNDPALAYSYSSAAPEMMIDYILYNDNFLNCVDARRVDEAGDISDHFPIVSNLVFIEEIDSTFQE